MIENQYKRRSKFTLTSNFKAPNTVPQMRGSTIASTQRDSQLSLYKYNYTDSDTCRWYQSTLTLMTTRLCTVCIPEHYWFG